MSSFWGDLQLLRFNGLLVKKTKRFHITTDSKHGLKESIKNKETAFKMIAQAVRIYNEKRLHWSLQFKTPEEVHCSYNENEIPFL